MESKLCPGTKQAATSGTDLLHAGIARGDLYHLGEGTAGDH